MYYLIYKTVNRHNGKYYIGSHETCNPYDSYLGSGTILRRAIKKYGKRNFTKFIIEFCDTRDIMYERERELVEVARKDERSYNVNVGGSGGWNFVNESGTNLGLGNPMHQQNAKKAVSVAIKSNWAKNRPKYLKISLDNLSKANNVGVIRSAYTRKLISENNRKMWNNPVIREKILYANRTKFEILSPGGEIFHTDQLEKFCIDRGLTYVSIWDTIRRKRPVKKGRSKGWMCKKI